MKVFFIVIYLFVAQTALSIKIYFYHNALPLFIYYREDELFCELEIEYILLA